MILHSSMIDTEIAHSEASFAAILPVHFLEREPALLKSTRLST
jgi:hypothetical protein